MADYGTQAFEQTNVTDSGNQFILENNGLKLCSKRKRFNEGSRQEKESSYFRRNRYPLK